MHINSISDCIIATEKAHKTNRIAIVTHQGEIKAGPNGNNRLSHHRFEFNWPTQSTWKEIRGIAQQHTGWPEIGMVQLSLIHESSSMGWLKGFERISLKFWRNGIDHCMMSPFKDRFNLVCLSCSSVIDPSEYPAIATFHFFFYWTEPNL